MSKKSPVVFDGFVLEPGCFVFKGKVVRQGNGACISFYKRFVGRNVTIILDEEVKK